MPEPATPPESEPAEKNTPFEEPAAEATLQRDRRTGRAWLTFVRRASADVVASLKEQGWRWSGRRQAWHNPRRLVDPPAGFRWSEGQPVDYADERAGWLEERAGRARAAASRELDRARGIARAIPLGQPILVGHHSERRHRRDVARLQRGYDRVAEGFDKSERLTGAARRSAYTAARRDDPGAMQTRLARLEARVRSAERILAGGGALTAHAARFLDDDRRQAAAIRAELVQEGVVRADGQPAIDVRRGDLVSWRGRPFLVARVSRKTIGGFVVGGGADAWPSRQADKAWLGEVLRPFSPALLAALEHRERLGGYYGDDQWRLLIAAALR